MAYVQKNEKVSEVVALDAAGRHGVVARRSGNDIEFLGLPANKYHLAPHEIKIKDLGNSKSVLWGFVHHQKFYGGIGESSVTLKESATDLKMAFANAGIEAAVVTPLWVSIMRRLKSATSRSAPAIG